MDADDVASETISPRRHRDTEETCAPGIFSAPIAKQWIDCPKSRRTRVFAEENRFQVRHCLDHSAPSVFRREWTQMTWACETISPRRHRDTEETGAPEIFSTPIAKQWIDCPKSRRTRVFAEENRFQVGHCLDRSAPICFPPRMDADERGPPRRSHHGGTETRRKPVRRGA